MGSSATTPGASLTRGFLACVIIAGTLALWTVVPVGWIRFTSYLPPGPQFVAVIIGCPLTMALVFMLLSWVDSHRRRLSPASPEENGGRFLFEIALVASAIVAVIALVAWWFFIADAANPSGPLQPI